MRGRRAKATLAGAFVSALALLALAGCGDSGPSTSALDTVATSSTTTTASLSKAAYIRQADEICSESTTAIVAITPGATSAEQAASTTQELQITRDELQSLQTLGAPEGDAPDAFLGDLDKVANQLSRKKLALERGDDAALAAIVTDIDAAEASAQSAAQAYGFKKCGEFGTPSGTLPTPSGGGGSNPATTTTVLPTTTVPVAPTTTLAPAPEPPPAPGGTGTPGTGTPPTTTSGGSGGSGGVGAG